MSFNKAEKIWMDLNTPLVMESTCLGATNPERLDETIAHNFVVVKSLDAGGNPSAATGGTYSVFVELTDGGGWVSTSSPIDATKTGGETITPDGEAEFVSFDGNPYRVKIVANAVTGVDHAIVVVNQNVT